MQTISAINSITLTSATGTLTGSSSTNVSDGDTVTIGTTTYRFKSAMAAINDIQIGGSGNSDTSLNNLIDAINGTGSAGTNWYAGTVANTQVTAGALAAHAFVVTAIAAGIYGQNIVTTETSAALAWAAATLTGGTGITIVGTTSLQTFTQPSQVTTIAEYPANPNWSRGHRMTNGAHIVRRNGSNFVAWLVNCFSQVAVALEPSLSWPPLITTQPAAATATGNASATGTLTGSSSTNVSDGDTVTIGAQVYRFKTVPSQAYDIFIGGSGNSDTSLTNLADAINGTGTAGTNWYAGTVANTQVTAGALAAHAFVVTSKAAGLASNAIATTKSAAVLAWGAATLTGGTDHAAVITVVPGVTETPLTYLWQYSANGTTGWTTATGTVNGTTYTNGTTASLTCTPTTTAQTGYFHRCILTNSSGTNTTTNAVLTIT